MRVVALAASWMAVVLSSGVVRLCDAADCRADPVVAGTLELRPLLSAVYYPAESGRAKPDRALYLEACRALGVAPAHALYVGDRERDCLAGARQAGLAVLRYAPGSGDTEELHAWADLLDRVAASGC